MQRAAGRGASHPPAVVAGGMEAAAGQASAAAEASAAVVAVAAAVAAAAGVKMAGAVAARRLAVAEVRPHPVP